MSRREIATIHSFTITKLRHFTCLIQNWSNNVGIIHNNVQKIFSILENALLKVLKMIKYPGTISQVKLLTFDELESS